MAEIIKGITQELENAGIEVSAPSVLYCTDKTLEDIVNKQYGKVEETGTDGVIDCGVNVDFLSVGDIKDELNISLKIERASICYEDGEIELINVSGDPKEYTIEVDKFATDTDIEKIQDILEKAGFEKEQYGDTKRKEGYGRNRSCLLIEACLPHLNSLTNNWFYVMWFSTCFQFRAF